jgi:tRNA-binding EMAP/Myf-like protein
MSKPSKSAGVGVKIEVQKEKPRQVVLVITNYIKPSGTIGQHKHFEDLE